MTDVTVTLIEPNSDPEILVVYASNAYDAAQTPGVLHLDMDEARSLYEQMGREMPWLRAELETVRGLLKALVGHDAPIVAFNDDYRPDDEQGDSELQCLACNTGDYRSDDQYEWMVDLNDPANHAHDCPWRLASEYLQKMEAQNE